MSRQGAQQCRHGRSKSSDLGLIAPGDMAATSVLIKTARNYGCVPFNIFMHANSGTRAMLGRNQRELS
jgi:hypothetical protein